MTTIIALFGGFLAGLAFIGIRLGKQIGFLGYLLGGVTGAISAIFVAAIALRYLHFSLPY
jgi:hypothetical protein